MLYCHSVLKERGKKGVPQRAEKQWKKKSLAQEVRQKSDISEHRSKG